MEEHNCPICGGEPVVLGQLGNRVHCRCRNCGADFSFEEDPPTVTCDACGQQTPDNDAGFCTHCS